MFLKSHSLVKIAAGFFLFALVSSFALAYLHTRAMAAMDMPMTGCPFMNEGTPVLCTMTPLEHIEAWQHMFLAIPATGILLLLCLVLLAICIPYFYTHKWSPQSLRVFNTLPPRIPNQSVFQSYIQEAFASGILNPKLF
jgi:hypothetical protein